MLADTVERELVRGHFESIVGELDRLEFPLLIDHDIEHAVAALANKMLMAREQRIEMLRPPEHQDLQLFIGNQFLQITIDRTQTNVGQFFPHPIVDLIGGGMR